MCHIVLRTMLDSGRKRLWACESSRSNQMGTLRGAACQPQCPLACDYWCLQSMLSPDDLSSTYAPARKCLDNLRVVSHKYGCTIWRWRWWVQSSTLG
jgi:hypothetical protein